MVIDDQIEIFQNFKGKTATEIFEHMDKDDAVDLLEALLDKNEQKAQELMNSLDVAQQIQLKRLLSYKEDTAGALMTPDYVSIPELLTVNDALNVYKKDHPKSNDAAFYLFIVNDFQQIKGIISIRDLLLSDSDTAIRDIRNNYPIKVHVDTDQEEVAKIFQKYRSMLLPVVDDMDVLLGVITVDDVVDVVIEEATEDLYKLSGTAGDDIESKKLLQGNIFYSIGHRLPWLGVSIIGGIIASFIMVFYSIQLKPGNMSLAIILSFIPLLIGLGGNVGNQSATIIVRAIATKDIPDDSNIRPIIRETSIGILIGVLVAVFIGVYVFLTTNNQVFSLCVALTIIVNTGFASLLGSTLPIILNRFNIDPAIASAPFISTAIDIIGQIIYFSIAMALFQLFL